MGITAHQIWTKRDFDIFGIPKFIFEVQTLEFDTIQPFTGLLNISD